MGIHAPRPLATPPLIVPDLRSPGVPMEALPVKLPPDLLDELQLQADRLGCSRGALARTLILRGVAALQAPAGEVA